MKPKKKKLALLFGFHLLLTRFDFCFSVELEHQIHDAHSTSAGHPPSSHTKVAMWVAEAPLKTGKTTTTRISAPQKRN